MVEDRTHTKHGSASLKRALGCHFGASTARDGLYARALRTDMTRSFRCVCSHGSRRSRTAPQLKLLSSGSTCDRPVHAKYGTLMLLLAAFAFHPRISQTIPGTSNATKSLPPQGPCRGSSSRETTSRSQRGKGKTPMR